MLSSNKTSLKIIDNIIIDTNLLKHKKEVSSSGININFDGISTSGSSNTFSFEDSSGGSQFKTYLNYYYSNSPSLMLRIKIYLYDLLFSKMFEESKSKKDIDLKDLKQFFEHIKSNTKNLDQSDINDILSNYENLVDSAISNNQTALVEKIDSYKNILKYEIILATSRFDSFLEEQDIIRFYNKCSRHEKYNTNLKLTYIKNFVKYIPTEVSYLKKEADDLKVFDNYVILHYDYDNSGSEETKAEKEKKKDPILFGLISGSRRLYYIADWIDTYCDLTFDKLITTIGKENVKLKDNINL